jgi:hypothetical protein
MKKSLFIVAISTFCVFANAANFVSGAHLLRDFRDPQRATDPLVALGYVIGVADSLESRGVICIPSSAKFGDAMAPVITFLGTINNNALSKSADLAITVALIRQWPCK